MRSEFGCTSNGICHTYSYTLNVYDILIAILVTKNGFKVRMLQGEDIYFFGSLCKM